MVVCGSTTGGLYEDPLFYMESAGDDFEEEATRDKNSEPYCAKLAATDGSVSFTSCKLAIKRYGVAFGAIWRYMGLTCFVDGVCAGRGETHGKQYGTVCYQPEHPVNCVD